MTEVFRARCIRALAERGRLGLAVWTCRALLDIALNAPVERLSAWAKARRITATAGDNHFVSSRSSGGRIMTHMASNLRFALRLLARRPALTLTLVLILGLGTGASTALFSIVDAALLRPLPYPDPDRILLVQQTNAEFGEFGFAPPYLADLRERVGGVESLAGFSPSWELTLTGLGEPRAIVGAYVTDGLFDVLGVNPIAGRLFDMAEHSRSGPQAVVVSRVFWDRYFGAATPLAGQTVRLNGELHTIVGVTPAVALPITASLVDRSTDIAELWLPFATNPYAELRAIPVMNVIGRLPEGVRLERVIEELKAVGASLSEDYPETSGDAMLTASWLRDVVTRDARRTVLTLFGAAILLLLIACVNVANLLLMRATARSHELAVRRSLGAGASQIASQLLTESLLIGAMGCVAGLFFGAWLTTTVLAPGIGGLPPSAEVRVDLRVAAFAAFLAISTSGLFGLAPALYAAGADPVGTMRRGGRVTGAGRLVRRTLVAAEVALAVTLLVGAGLLGRSFWALSHVDPGFRTEELLRVPVSLSGDGRETAGTRRVFLDALLPALGDLPGVSAVAAVNRLPLEGGNVFVGVEIEGDATENENPSVDRRVATPGYFRLVGIPLVEGREFGREDLPGASVPTAIVNAAFVRRFWPNEGVIGRRLRLMLRSGPGPWLTVVGVAGDVRHHGLDQPVQPEVYVPYAQASVETMVVVLRAIGDAATLAAHARQAVWQLDPNMPLDDIGTVESLVSESVAAPRFRALVVIGFGALALLLAAIGIYGLVSNSVEQRTRETGVRIALGARPNDVVGEVVWEGLVLAGWGTLFGLAGAWALGRMLSGLLYGVEPADPITFGGTAAVTVVVALSASYLPARRAAYADPLEALRKE
jgi:predicted permease